MSPEAQRIAIAEACGYFIERGTHFAWVSSPKAMTGHNCGLHLSDIDLWRGHFSPHPEVPFLIPDYLHDLNAMAEAVQHECEKQGFPFQERYTRELRSVVTRRRRDCNEMQVDYWMAEATAAQRAEAFLRTLNLYTT